MTKEVLTVAFHQLGAVAGAKRPLEPAAAGLSKSARLDPAAEQAEADLSVLFRKAAQEKKEATIDAVWKVLKKCTPSRLKAVGASWKPPYCRYTMITRTEICSQEH